MDSAEEVVNFGKSMIVPSVQELAKQSVVNIPPRYLRPHQDPPSLPDHTSLPSVPIIDLHILPADFELERLHSACRDWGFFQVINHGVRTSLLEKLKLEVVNFFKLSYDEKKKLWQEPDNHEGFGQLFVVSEEQKLDWSDMFYITTLPLNLRNTTDLFQKLPPNLRETIEYYSVEVKKLAMEIIGFMGKALKMDGEEMRELFSDGVQSMRMNYYPPCPEPDKAIGFTPHSDADALTILLQLMTQKAYKFERKGDGFLLNLSQMPL